MKTYSKPFHNYVKRETCPNLLIKGLPYVFASLFLASILSFFFFFYSPNSLILVPKQDHAIIENPSQKQQHQHANTSTLPPWKSHKEEKTCDLFKGHWIRKIRDSSYYTNSSCTTIPYSKNCFKHGRTDNDFLNWKWKPDQCDLPMFDPRIFLQMVRGKKLAFIGDSVARNHMDSLLCLLSQEETPQDIYKDAEDRSGKFYFPKYDFSLIMIWNRFLVQGEERMINGTGTGIFDLQLDKTDENWANVLHELDYAIISSGHWFFRLIYLHEGGKLVGCIYCSESNVKHYDVDMVLSLVFKTSLKHINNCKECEKGKLLTILRTFAPSHFENGVWNTGGHCNRTGPINEGDVNFGAFEWKLRDAQMEEFENAKSEGKTRFKVLDVTRAMMMRPDGHPGDHWGNKWMKGYNDCTHWCLPGAIDVWNELLLATLQREVKGL